MKPADWENILVQATKPFPILEQFWRYPYRQYSPARRDGEWNTPWPRCCLTRGAWLHEWMHSWYQGMMAPRTLCMPGWMKGFTQYEDRVSRLVCAATRTSFAQTDGCNALFQCGQKAGRKKPLITHADHFNTNFCLPVVSYSKGSRLPRVIGIYRRYQVRDRILLNTIASGGSNIPMRMILSAWRKKVSDQNHWYKQY